eukprot:COSAG01_NODE_604_length_14894_cov_24.503211_5_plen_141_part_00
MPVPVDDHSRASDPARDANLFQLSSAVPSTLLPLPLALALPHCRAERAGAYRALFLAQAALSLGALAVLARLEPPPTLTLAEPAEGAADANRAQQISPLIPARAPLGARICDRLFFAGARRADSLQIGLTGSDQQSTATR